MFGFIDNDINLLNENIVSCPATNCRLDSRSSPTTMTFSIQIIFSLAEDWLEHWSSKIFWGALHVSLESAANPYSRININGCNVVMCVHTCMHTFSHVCISVWSLLVAMHIDVSHLQRRWQQIARVFPIFTHS